MGLHLNYELRLPPSASDAEVDQKLVALHAYARELPFEEVSPLFAARPHRLPRRPHETADGWLRFSASIIAEPYDDDEPPLTGDVATARGFVVHPGDKSESATFGFLLREDAAGSLREWFWHCSCKTQYASVVSDAHLVACHTALVSLLDHAITLGVDVIVRDETHYWETRDESRLIDEVHAMNRLVAAVAGHLSDAMGAAHRVEAPVFEHRRFERLEMGE